MEFISSSSTLVKMQVRLKFHETIALQFRPDVDSDVISGVFIDPTGVKVREKFCKNITNRGRNF